MVTLLLYLSETQFVVGYGDKVYLLLDHCLMFLKSGASAEDPAIF